VAATCVCTVDRVCHEANIQGGGGKTVHVVFKYLSRAFCKKRGAGGVTRSPPHIHSFSELIRGNFICRRRNRYSTSRFYPSWGKLFCSNLKLQASNSIVTTFLDMTKVLGLLWYFIRLLHFFLFFFPAMKGFEKKDRPLATIGHYILNIHKISSIYTVCLRVHATV
jgi:hypothetical protein